MGDRETGVLLTGATGFLGGEVLARLLERGERPVYALVRAPNEEDADARLRVVVESLLRDPGSRAKRAIAVAGDVTNPGLGIGAGRREWLAERVDRVIHCAASVSFTLGIDESRAINVEGTRRALDFGQLCARRGGLEYLVHVSTAYVAGTHAGTFSEQDLDCGQGFRNAYERSKFEAVLMVRERRASLPVQVVRPSIVVGDSRTGWTPTFNVVYGPLRAFSRGAFRVLPARRRSPVDVVPVDYVADGILALAGRPGTTAHLVAGEGASTVGELIELASEYTGRPAPRVLPPTLYRRAIHPLLVRSFDRRRRRALRRSEALFPYFAMGVHYDNAFAARALAPAGIKAPRLRSYFDRLMDFAEGSHWGRRLPARHEAARATTTQRRRRARRSGSPAPTLS
jgi:long-chain acyl-CoA synthetase